MELDPKLCYRALRSRDRRFDGRFFTGVTSTGVYCRPVCPAQTPSRDRCRFFPHASTAEEAGFRPCRRCRPESSPGTPAWLGPSATVSRALRLIDEGALDRAGVEELAGRLGIGDRHLRRLFLQHLGVPPRAVALTRRVHFAKRLLEETDLPVSQIAVSSGFNNPRRFNAAFRKCFARSPREVRAVRHTPAAERAGRSRGEIRLQLAYRPPLAWEALLAYLEPRAIPGVERLAGGVYRRTMSLDGVDGVLSVSHDAARGLLELIAPASAAVCLFEVVERIRALFDLGSDPSVIDAEMNRHPVLRRLAAPAGLRLPGCWDRFELAVRAILGQQVTVKGATTLTGRLVRSFGRSIGAGGSEETEPEWIFPEPRRLAQASIGGLAKIGVPESRARTLQTLARAVVAGEPVLRLAGSLEETIARLTRLDGIGDWTAQYIAMRALREPDAFPAGDLGLRRALAEGDRPLAAAELGRMAEAWRPWRAAAAFRLWTGSGPSKERR